MVRKKYIILFETEDSGKIFGKFTHYEDAKNAFHLIAEDILSKLPSSDKLFFKLYGIFEMPIFDFDYELYKVSSHLNKISEYELIFSLGEFALYLIELENEFEPQKIKRNQNNFFFSKSKFFAGNIELLMN